MAKDYLQVPINGTMRGLKFNFGTLKFIGELTGESPFKTTDMSIYDVYKEVKTIVHAGLLSNALSQKKELDLSEKEIENAICEWSIEQAQEVLKKFQSAYEVKVPGEVETDPQPKAPSVV